MKNGSIKAAVPGARPDTSGRNHRLQAEQRDYLTISQQSGLDGDSSDEEFPTFKSDEFIKLARRWCESKCLSSSTPPPLPPAFFAHREAVHRPQKLRCRRPRPRRSPRIKIIIKNSKSRTLKGVRRSARIAARMGSRDVNRVI